MKNIDLKYIVRNYDLGIPLFAFMIPLFPNLYSLMIMIMVVEQIIRLQFAGKKRIKKKLCWNNPGLWLVLFYLMHFISFTYTENMDFAWMDVGMKASFFVFPLFFLLFQPRLKWEVIAFMFLTGVFASVVLNLVLSFDKYMATDVHYYLFDERLSHFMHRGYWSIYLTIAYVLIWMNVFKTARLKWIKYLGLLILLIIVFMTASKVGILLVLMATAYYLYQLSLHIKRKIYLIGIVLILIGSVFAVNQIAPQLGSRIERAAENMFKPIEELDKENIESTSARVFMWDTATDLIKDNFWLGVGSGDVKDELQALNYKKGYIGVAEKNLNSHNQFLNSHAAIGFFGVVFLFLAYFFALSFSKRPFWGVQNWIVFILFVAALPEAFLETQAGIVPCAFILVLMGYKNRLADLNLLNSSNMK